MDHVEGVECSLGETPTVGSCHVGDAEANAAHAMSQLRDVVVVLGKKPARGQQLHPHFQRNLARAIELAREGDHDALVITGGPTRKGQPPEAEIGAREVGDACPVPVLLESEARTTSENVRFVRDMLAGTPVERITVVTSAYHVRRTRFLLEYHWPEIANVTVYESGIDTSSALERALNFLYLKWARIDPQEHTVVRFTRRVLRNGDGT